MKTIVLAGGCFWGLQKFFDQFDGIISTETGYANGNCDHPDYRSVCNGSGHAEAVKVTYKDSISTARILAAFFAAIDPFSLNRQGNDTGINYRTGIYTDDPEESSIARAMLEEIEKHSGRKVQVEVLPLKDFWSAEDYHQKYLDKNPSGYCHLPRNLLTGHRLPTLSEVLETYPTLGSLLSSQDPKAEA